MMKSHVTEMPDFTKLVIPEAQRTIPVGDKQIFRELQMQYRKMEDQLDGAGKGDYVLTKFVRADGKEGKVHIELGGKAYAQWQPSLMGSKAGEEIRWEDTVLRVLSVRKVVGFPLTDTAIKSLNIPGVTSVADYRRNFLREHGEEIVGRVFRAISHGLMSQVLSMTDFALDEEEVASYNEQQKRMLQNISGDVNARILKAYGGDDGKTLEECYTCFYEDNKRSFMIQILGRALALQNQAAPTQEEYEQFLNYYCLAFDTTQEAVEKEGLREDVLRSFYMQYCISSVRDYYKSIVNFSVAEIPVLPQKA